MSQKLYRCSFVLWFSINGFHVLNPFKTKKKKKVHTKNIFIHIIFTTDPNLMFFNDHIFTYLVLTISTGIENTVVTKPLIMLLTKCSNKPSFITFSENIDSKNFKDRVKEIKILI